MMRRISIALLMATAGIAFAAPPTDDEVDAALKAFVKAQSEDRQSPDYRKKLAETAEAETAKLDISSMTEPQIEKLRTMLSMVPDKKDEIAKRLAELGKEPTADGAMAMVLEMSIQPRARDMAEAKKNQREWIARILAHPGIQQALKEGRGGEVLSMMGQHSWKDWEGTEVPRQVEAILKGDLSPRAAVGTINLFDSVAGDESVDKDTRERLRTSILGAIRRAAKNGTEADERYVKYLERSQSYLDGPFAKGTLLNNPAPEVDFTWVSGDHKNLKTLADLQGKVVVVDFWATWCGPCIASFPNVRKLVEHYQGYPVEVIGVTSLQGYHMKRSLEDKKVERIDCADDPTKEMGLMPEFMKDMDMTWPVAFSSQDVFNPDFGVRGIPHVAILDPKGVVRYRGLHPGTDLNEKYHKINALLKEAGLPFPAEDDAPEKKGTSN